MSHQSSWDVAQRSTQHVNPTSSVSAFLRISKTGSTELSRFIYRQPSVHILTDAFSPGKGRLIGLGNCMYGYSETANISKRVVKATPCAHWYYEDMVEKNLSRLSASVPSEYGMHDGEEMIQPRYFAMIRDLYERLVSLFHYSKWDSLDHDFDEEQRRYLESDDLAAWIMSLRKPENSFISHQYMRFNYTNVEGAMALIEGEEPTIFTLLNECFEASLRLLLENFRFSPQSQWRGQIAEFAQRNQTRANKGSYEFDSSLRSRAIEWFRDDFLFYQHAVKQFQFLMERSTARSGGDSTYFDQCQFYGAGSSSED